MIRNERQLKITKKKIRDFENALAPLEQAEASHPELRKRMQIESIKSDVAQLKREVDDYEQLKTGAIQVLDAPSFDALPDLITKARIARNLTQKQLAEKLNMREQQIQRYETSGYASASFAVMQRVIDALDITIEEKATLNKVVQ